MRLSRFPSRIKKVFRRVLHILANPAASDRGRGGIILESYRGYGSSDEMFLIGRVFRQRKRASGFGSRPVVRDIIDLLRRLFRRGIAQAVVEVQYREVRKNIKTDGRGYFHAHLHHRPQIPSEPTWQPVRLKLIHPSSEPEPEAAGRIFIPPESAKFAVISDIDDTVVFTGVADKIKMAWRLFVQNARSRTAFPGVGAFYRALHHGFSDTDMNPMLYVSRGPWSIYEVLDEFFNFHQIPVGPILLLRDWGLSVRRPFPRRTRGHKMSLINRAMWIYHDLPFILIGDSGQRDPEVYADIVRRHPGRVLSVYIRNIEKDPLRKNAVEKLAREVEKAGSTMLLAVDSFEMAVHAADQGFISPRALADVLIERRAEKNIS